MDRTEYEKAHEKVESLKSFNIHFIVFVFVHIMLVVINVKTYKQSEGWWFIYPLIGWGIGLAIQGFSLSSFGLFGQRWKDKKIRKYLRDNKVNVKD